MSYKGFDNFLGVRWVDGLLVNCKHLSHTDLKTDSMISDLLFASIDQPGIINIDSQSGLHSQLIEIESFERKDTPDDFSLSINILNPFRCIAPNGNNIIAIPNNEKRPGIPLVPLKTDFTITSHEYSDYLLCIKQINREEYNIRRDYGIENTVELIYPCLSIILISEEQYISGILSDYQDYVPISSITIQDERAEVSKNYIPPLLKLNLTRHFDSNLLGSIISLLDDLMVISAQYISAGGNVLSRDNVSPQLRTRYNLYTILNSILVSNCGLVRYLGNLSPAAFYSKIMYPLMRWFDQYKNCLSKQEIESKNVDSIYTKIKNYSLNDFYAGTFDALENSRIFISELKNFIEYIG